MFVLVVAPTEVLALDPAVLQQGGVDRIQDVGIYIGAINCCVYGKTRIFSRQGASELSNKCTKWKLFKAHGWKIFSAD
jgi:hypothetical protein